ncbi:hypothetical protein EEL87_17460 [Salmonella enterica]|nr:hypothetical protein [Salmonella enterica]EBR8476719.1 hypothetical protein [Salmonella enterica subsp. enterica serovar Nima]EBV0502912.1 hypothetical protein [Salmonella enterica subsp. enterica serovar Teddington]EBV1890042.1 hypothetical protein [Salmonella enterica subsp. enterica serovar Coquilhatville]EBV7250921.1 hypothetical protein [Salmonella enterica subsp. enterica serovar Pomona]EBX2983063.1 hypothetical protein [Salmonella enterica subsp. enterica serovar Glostrup]ECI4030215
MDEFTKFLNRLLDILLLKYPLRTTFGCLFGIVMWVFLYIFKKFLLERGFLVDWVWCVGCLALCILIMNIKTIVEVYKGSATDEQFSNTLNTIDSRHDLSDEQKRVLINQIFINQINKLSETQLRDVEKNVIEK